MNEDTLIIPPKVKDDPILAALVRVALAQLFVVGAFVGAALFALGILLGVVIS